MFNAKVNTIFFVLCYISVCVFNDSNNLFKVVLNNIAYFKVPQSFSKYSEKPQNTFRIAEKRCYYYRKRLTIFEYMVEHFDSLYGYSCIPYVVYFTETCSHLSNQQTIFIYVGTHNTFNTI